ncbi:MAG TPA: two-component regulator propeller domain-containing protein [Ohtaekwangia sp.]|uniref:sensor histidine kinase n=1 Tax=Ohtaekwangia sp. TaxID=2066019 RepID=UPI002F928CCE
MLSLIYQANAQPSPFRFDHYTIKDGLSQSQPYSIFQDSYGYIWIGTQDGLNRFDGTQFKVFKNNPFDSTTLTHNWVWTVQEDDRGDIWVGTFQGLCRYIRSEDRFVQYYHILHDSTSISGNRPNYIVKDKKGRLWISSWGSGLNLYDANTNTFRSFKNNPDDQQSLSDNAVRTLFCDSHGILWVGTWNGGLNRVVEDESGIHFQRFDAQGEYGFESGNRITSIAEDKQGNLWIGSYASGLTVFERSTNRFIHVPDFGTNDVNKVMCDSHGNLWIGTNNGLRFFDDQSKSFHTYQHDPSNPNGISSNAVYALMEDRSGIVWISGSGLDLYDPHKNLFKTFRNKQGDPNSLSQNMIWSFCEDDAGKIWVGTESGPINVFDPASRSFKQITISDNRGNIASNVYKMLFKDGVFWIASFNAGLVRYDKYSSKARFFLGSHNSPLGKITMVNELMMDDDNTLWIGTNEDGLLHYNPETEEVTQYKMNPKEPNSIGSNFINCIYRDTRGNIWIGFWGGGLSIYNKKSGKFTNYQYDRKNDTGLSDQVVISINQQNDSIFWICTHSGLNKFNVNTEKFTHFFEKDGLANNVVYEMLQDGEGNYWISSNGGISKFNPKTYTFKKYTETDGLQSNEFNSNAFLKSSTGEFYFGGVNGFNVFNPSEIKENKTPPALLIQGYTVFGKTYLPKENIALNYSDNYITFSFAALEFSAPGNIKYAYKLEGVDDDWTDAGNIREAHYTNLDPGNYTFRVKAANPDGYWTEPGASVILTIRPPFWQTWWFTALVILVSLAIMYAIHRYRLEQSLKVERLRNKIASDLHDEVGSSLTRISIYSDLVQNGSEENESRTYLKGISDLSREVVTTMSDIVWSIDNRYDTLEAVILRMKDFATEVLQAKNIVFEFQASGIDNKKILDPALKQNIYLIFKEAINNIVKHAQASRVHVTLATERGEFRMTIHDNGKGVPANGSPKGNGLRNMKRRAEAIEGQFSIENKQGTTIVLTTRKM